MKKIIFIDTTCQLNHKSIKNRALGASEYQCYNLLEKLSKIYEIICYNNTTHVYELDNIVYKSWKTDLIKDDIDPDAIIIIQRMFIDHHDSIYGKIKENKIFLWIHDMTSKNVYLFNYNEEDKTKYKDELLYKKEVLNNMYDNKNIHFVFVSNFIKEVFKSYFNNFKIEFEENRLKVIYNILYEDEYSKVKNQQIAINKNYITYASAWQKGIEQVVNIFEHAIKQDNQLTLVLMTPGYDWHKYQQYAEELKNKYLDNIIIHGPVNKDEYCKIIKESLVVLTTTFKETFGCVFAESYYLGTPVIADYRSGAVKEIIDNNHIVNFDNKKETVDLIMHIKNNRESIHVTLDDKFMLNHNINLWLSLL